MKSTACGWRRSVLRLFGTVCALGLLVLGVAACGSSDDSGGSSSSATAAGGSSKKLTEVSYGWQVTGGQAPVQVADSKGYFADEGIKLKRVTFANGTATTAALLGGQIDLGAATPGLILAAAQSGLAQIKVIAPLYSWHGDLQIYAKKGGPITSLKDLAGKTIGVSSLKTNVEAYVLDFLDKAGVDTKTVKFVAVPTADVASQIRSGRIAAGLGVEPFVTPYRDQLTSVIPNLFEPQPGVHKTVGWIVANGKFAQQKPELVAAFQRAVYRALVLLQDPKNQGEVRKAIGQVAPTVKPDVLQSMTVPEFNTDMNSDALPGIGQIMKKWGFLKEVPDTSALFDKNWPPKAAAGS
jgi:NitT/TauT family transport system substrate-binding protein